MSLVSLVIEKDGQKAELKIENQSEEYSKEIVNNLFNLFKNPADIAIDPVENELLKYKEGYQAFQTDKVGLHHTASEWEVKEEVKSSLDVNEVQEIQHETDNISSNEDIPVVEDEEVHKNFNCVDDDKYQTFYICPSCKDKGKHHIKRSRIYVNCKKCGKRMRIREAHKDGFPMKDDYGNMFIAGDFKRADELSAIYSFTADSY